MIKFFRKIRYDLMEKNKTGKYLKYAIGEIVLVVIGILIALQINNLNEVHKTNLLEKDLLSEVKNGLEYDLDQLNNAIDFHRSSLKSQDFLVDWVDNKIDYNDSLEIHFLRSVFNFNVQFKETPYETLQQIGLQIVKNDTLRNQISNLYDLKYQNIDWWQEDYEKIKSRFRNSFADLGFEYRGLKSRSDVHMAPIDTLKVRSDKAYIFNLKTTRGTLDVYTNNIMIDVQQEIKKTIEMLDREIKEK